MKLAAWSGPRNLSTAMMYCFSGHPNFDVIDEPFYAAYLAHNSVIHPMQDAVIKSQPHDPEVVIKNLLASNRTEHLYQKHMTQHMTPNVPRDWLEKVEHLFLIRHPARVLASYNFKRENPTLEDIGFTQQLEIFQEVKTLGKRPVVVDASDIRAAPEQMIRAICSAFEISFAPEMMEWPIGPKPFDGVWADHWYNAVHKSTCFGPCEGPLPKLSQFDPSIIEPALEIYETLAGEKLTL